MIVPLAVLLIMVFGIKAALFGLWFWMPGTYSVIPAAVAGFFGGIMAEVGVYCIFRVCTLMFLNDADGTPALFSPLGTIILVTAGLTMFIGVLGAAAQTNFRGILTYHISSQVGYLILGLGIFTVGSIAAAIFYTIHYTLCKSSLFLCAGVAEKLTGRQDVREMGGLVSHPMAALLFVVGILSLAGLPPLSGFWAKFLLVKAGFEEAFGNNDLLIYIMVGVALATSLLTLYSMTKIWQKAYWGEPKHERIANAPYKAMLPSIAFLVIIGIVLGLGAEPFIDLCTEAAEQLMNRQEYISAVMGGGG
jgi:multicomponent Na+:H+ antiporter subunit D